MAALTPKQKLFARCVGGGKSLADSYRDAYSAENMNGASIRNEASKLMSNPAITMMVETIQRAKERAVVASSVSDGDRVRTKLRTIMDEAEGTPAENTMLRAADLLGKSVGLYKDVVETITPKTADEVQAELDAYLKERGISLESVKDAVH